ncbi:unnamed protein product [Periconia digitata]|uniref:Wax synthase domain-containing protein n=1 Tax=Periconia digitata TaxID=1303443 RepID=A0A9W4UBT9_9PLEO|nr:unnamed protein product [Periconia digitata]
MIPRNTWPHTHYDIIQKYRAQYDSDIKSGDYEPWVYPWGTLGATIVIIYLLIDHRKRPWLRHARFAVFPANLLHSVYTVKYVRAKTVATAFGVGLISLWSSIWVLAILVCHDGQSEFQRIERSEGVFKGQGKRVVKGDSRRNDNITAIPGSLSEDEIKDDSPIMNIDQDSQYKSSVNGRASASISNDHLGPHERDGEFAWQPFPITPFIERLDWVMDLFCNFRGVGWNWRTTAIPPPPKAIQLQLLRNTTTQAPPPSSFKRHSSQPTVYPTRRALLIANAKTLFIGYFALDVIKTLVIHDPYFWGLVSASPAPYLPWTPYLTRHPILLRIFRLTLAQFSILYALQTVFALAPLFFAGVLGPNVLGARAEPWTYPDTWGPYSAVLDRGLGGWWSSWWHQTFRFAFEAPSRAILVAVATMKKKKNEKGGEKTTQQQSLSSEEEEKLLKSKGAKALQLCIAFALSGALHATGSYTAYGETHPFSGPMAFFALQALGCFVEAAFLRPFVASFGAPTWVKRSFTFVYVHVWFYHTAGMLCDDFARAGIWLCEPLPVSVLRGLLGLGVEGDTWWLAGGSGIGWYSDAKWYRSGLAL